MKALKEEERKYGKKSYLWYQGRGL
jgi:hypothetical protein